MEFALIRDVTRIPSGGCIEVSKLGTPIILSVDVIRRLLDVFKLSCCVTLHLLPVCGETVAITSFGNRNSRFESEKSHIIDNEPRDPPETVCKSQ